MMISIDLLKNNHFNKCRIFFVSFMEKKREINHSQYVQALQRHIKLEAKKWSEKQILSHDHIKPIYISQLNGNDCFIGEEKIRGTIDVLCLVWYHIYGTEKNLNRTEQIILRF